eukprot:SAG31_NODE_4374_length_3297_cov_1.307067_6_plen_24_part_01
MARQNSDAQVLTSVVYLNRKIEHQ